MAGPPRAVEIPIEPAAEPSALLAAAASLDVDEIALRVDGAPTTAGEVLRRFGARSIVAARPGGPSLAWQAPGIDPARPQRCFSVSKSLTGVLAARAVEQGVLDRGARVGEVVAELASTAVGDASVGQVADMVVSVAYDEDYDGMAGGSSTGAGHGFGDYVVALGLEDPDAEVAPDAPRGVRPFIAALRPGSVPHGHALLYGTPICDLLVWLLEQATDRGWVDLLREWIWVPAGAADAAHVQVDPEGVPTGGGGLAATTHDLARVGVALLDGRVVAPSVLDRIAAGGDVEAFERSTFEHLVGYSYRDQWWIPPRPNRVLSGWGIHGQVLWVDLDVGVVVAIHSGGGPASDHERDRAQDALCRAVVDLLAEPAGAG